MMPLTILVSSEQYCPIILSDSCALVSVIEEVFHPVQIIGDSINLQLNRQFIVADSC